MLQGLLLDIWCVCVCAFMCVRACVRACLCAYERDLIYFIIIVVHIFFFFGGDSYIDGKTELHVNEIVHSG